MHPCFAGGLGVIHRRIGLMTIDVKRAAARKIQAQKWVEIIVVTTADDGPLAIVWHDE